MAELLNDRQRLLELIMQKSGKNARDIEALAKEKREKFSGLLTEDGALFLLAKEFGASMELEQTVSEQASIAKLEKGMQGIDVKATVKQVFAPREFERNGKKGTRCTLVVSDSSGETMLTLWHKDVKKLDELAVEKGTVLLLKNCFVSEYNGQKQLNLSYNGALEVLEQPKESATKKIREITAGMKGINLIARVQQAFDTKKFDKADGTGKGELCPFVLNDGTGTMRAVAWNELAKKADRLDAGTLVKISNAYTKQGMRGIELHLGNSARIMANPKTENAVPELAQLLRQNAVKKSIATLQEGQELQEINAEILDLNPSLYFLVCPKCGKKPERLEGKLACNNCGEVKKGEIRLVLSATVSDNSGIINAVFYGEQAEQLSGLTGIMLEQELETKDRDTILNELRQKLQGRKITLFGNARKNKMNEELEFAVKATDWQTKS